MTRSTVFAFRLPCAALLVFGCGGNAQVNDDPGDDVPEPSAPADDDADGPSVVPTSIPVQEPDAPILTPGEPEPTPDPVPEPTAPAPCEDTVCNPGQRCEVTDGAGSCVDNTCEDLMCAATELCEAHELGGFVCVDNGCSDDVDCPPEQHCGEAGTCVDDVCVPQARACEGDGVRQCSSSGSVDEVIYSCSSPAHFTSACMAGGADATGCTCEDDWDCPAFTTCEVGLCQGTGKEPSCKLPPVAFADTPPTVEIHWGGDSSDADSAHDGSPEQSPAPWADFSHVQATPMVANLDDDNGDGLINELDFPEILFVTYRAGEDDTAILRAIHGGGPSKGRDMFAVCGDLVWTAAEPFDTTTTACPESGAEIPSRNSLAVGDVDRDGVPEIVYGTSSGAIRILSNTGQTRYLSPDELLEDPLSGSVWGTMPSIADLDHAGLAELVFGREVYTLAIADMPIAFDGGVPVAEGQLYIEHHLRGTGTRGQHGDEGPTSCVADLHSGPGQEIFAGTTLYRLPTLTACATPPCLGTLDVVWDANQVNADLPEDEGYCAVADVWGADPLLAPGPDNPPDELPEAILLGHGTLQIFDGETGQIVGTPVDLAPDNGSNDRRGGAPNVDDFDGDGFMEIASALEEFYRVVDLQEPSDQCPAWPDPMDRILMPGVDDNPNVVAGLTRDPGAACTTAADCNAGATCNTVLGQCVCLHNGWHRTSDDASSRATSSSVFDFNGDGAAEVLYNDECEFRVFDGVNGSVLYNEISRSRTAMENPIVADVDNDGNAEAVTVLNTEQTGRCDDDDGPIAGPNGLRVWGDPLDTWVSARRIWNQFAYHVTNVTEAGGIPVHEAESWRPYNGRTYNTYRSQPRSYGVAPDLQVTGVSLSSPDVACGELGEILEIAFEITNAGDLRVGPGVEVSFYGVWDDMEAELMGPSGPLTYVLTSSLEPGRSLIGSVVFDIADQGQTVLPTEVRVVVDTGGADGSDFGAERECIEDNNDRSAEVTPGEPRPDLGIVVGEATVDCSTRIASIAVTITNSGTADATGVVLEIYAGDPASGGTSMAVIEVGDIPAGETVTLTAEVPEFPQNRSITFWGVVDPNDTVLECNEADNRDPADNPVICNVTRIAR